MSEQKRLNQEERIRAALREELIAEIKRLDFVPELGEAVARNLGTEKTMSRMIGYLRNVKPRKEELIVDEMLAIMEDRKRWIAKKNAEYYNSKYNELLYYGLTDEEDE